MKKRHLCILFAGTSLSWLNLLSAGPIIAGGELNFQASAAVTESSRVVPQVNSPSDFSYTFTPALLYSRDKGDLQVEGQLSVAIRRYVDNAQFDSDTINLQLQGELPFSSGAKITGTWSVNYFDGIEASSLINRNLDLEYLDLDLQSDYAFGRRLSLRTRARYRERSSKGIGDGFQNENLYTILSAGLHARELIRGRVGVYAEYQVSERERTSGFIDEDTDFQEAGANFGLTGQLLPEQLFPKLEADISFGFTSNTGADSLRSANNERRNRLVLNGRLAYPANKKTDVTLVYRRSQDVTDDDQTVERTGADLAIEYRPRPRINIYAAATYYQNDFIFNESDRNDEVLDLSLSAAYLLRKDWNASLGIKQRDSNSNIALSDYDATEVILSTTMTF